MTSSHWTSSVLSFEGRGVRQAFDEFNRKFAMTAVGVGRGGMKRRRAGR